MSRPTQTVAVPALGMDFDVLAGDTIIGPSIANGTWEAGETALFQAHLFPGARVLDLGANVGWYACMAIRAGAEVHAFEPVPHIAEVTARNIERANAVGPGRGQLFPFAAGAERGTANIALSPDNFGDNRVVDADRAPEDMRQADLVTIQVERVDDHVQGPYDLLKIDTQGSEWLALTGAEKALAASPKLALYLEFWPYALRGAEPAELLKLLFDLGFSLGKATEAPYPMTPERILSQALARDPVKGGLDLYGTRGRPFHVLGPKARLHGMWRSWREA